MSNSPFVSLLRRCTGQEGRKQDSVFFRSLHPVPFPTTSRVCQEKQLYDMANSHKTKKKKKCSCPHLYFIFPVQEKSIHAWAHTPTRVRDPSPHDTEQRPVDHCVYEHKLVCGWPGRAENGAVVAVTDVVVIEASTRDVEDLLAVAFDDEDDGLVNCLEGVVFTIRGGFGEVGWPERTEMKNEQLPIAKLDAHMRVTLCSPIVKTVPGCLDDTQE